MALSVKIRLQKFLAEAGVASRRQSEQLILEGRVEVNGQRVQELGTRVDPLHDRVTFDGASLKAKKKVYVALHKPRGCVVTRSDPEGRTTIAQFLPREWTTVYPVGRLDYQSEGLIFLTNDGDFALRLTHPRFGVTKKYQVQVRGKADAKTTAALLHGVRDEGQVLRATKARLLKANESHSLIEVELREGKNRELRRMLEGLGFTVVLLKRTQIGPIKLGELPAGKWRLLGEREIAALLSGPPPPRPAQGMGAAPRRPAAKEPPGSRAGGE